MAEPSVGGRLSAASATSAGRPDSSASPKRLDPEAGLPDPSHGPDYVDDWMARNLAPSIVDLMRNCCTSFLRWNLLRLLHADHAGITPESLALAVGANPLIASGELEVLASLGLVRRHRRGGHITYRLEHASAMGEALDTAVRAYDESGEFRFALVYSIVRASHRGAAVD